MRKAKGSVVVDNSIEALVIDLWGDREKQEQKECEEQSSISATSDTEAVELQTSTSEATAAIRLAWSAAYSIRTAAIIVVMFVVSAVVIALIFNPEMTLIEVVNAYIQRFGAFIAKLGK